MITDNSKIAIFGYAVQVAGGVVMTLFGLIVIAL
jgi:hypothetical protein